MTENTPPIVDAPDTLCSKIEEQTKANLIGFLPDAIAQALRSYYSFSQQTTPDEAKEFSAHHNACKVAIAHIELLIKLARWADLPDENSEDQNDNVILAAMMQQAQMELQQYYQDNKTKKKKQKNDAPESKKKATRKKGSTENDK